MNARSSVVILLADDDEEDLQMTVEALTKSRLGNDLRVARDGEEGDHDVDIEAARAGAADYLVKGRAQPHLARTHDPLRDPE